MGKTAIVSLLSLSLSEPSTAVFLFGSKISNIEAWAGLCVERPHEEHETTMK
jgi:hypothetical protein